MVKILIFQYEKLIGGGIVTKLRVIRGTAKFCYKRILFYKHTFENFKILSIRTIY